MQFLPSILRCVFFWQLVVKDPVAVAVSYMVADEETVTDTAANKVEGTDMDTITDTVADIVA